MSIYNRFFGLVAQVRMCPEPSSNRRSRFISLTRKRSITNDVGHEKRCVLNVSTSMGWMLFAIPATVHGHAGCKLALKRRTQLLNVCVDHSPEHHIGVLKQL